MMKKQYLQIFHTLTKCIFTVLTAQAALLLAGTYTLLTEPMFSITQFRLIPLCTEYLAAGILLYVIFASGSALAVREYGT